MLMKPRMITEDEKKEILSLDRDEITMDKLKELFAFIDGKQARFLPNDRLMLNANEFYNKEKISTTVGRVIVNKVLLSPNIIPMIGYQNVVLDGDGIEDLDKKVINLLIEGKITDVHIIHDYFDQCNWLGYGPSYFMDPGLNTKMYLIDKQVKDLKEKLMEENKEAIMKNDVNVINEIENALIDLSKQLLKDEPGYQIYQSGCRGSFGNNYKNSVLMRGAIVDFENPTLFKSSMASLTEGIPKEDLDIYANILTAGTYARSKNTERGGYLMKQYNRAFQHVTLGIRGSDCKTTRTIGVKITGENKKLFLYRFILDGGKEVMLDNDNIGKYIGKRVKMRSPMYCESDKICNKCVGDLLYRIGINNAGLLTNVIGGVIQGKSMKQFHDSTIHVRRIDYNSYISEL